jgi:hypothetical protein
MSMLSIEVGDWSGDGHGMTETLLINVNRTNAEIMAAYKEASTACRVTVLGDTQRKGMIKLFREYEDNKIPTEAVYRLRELGIVFEDILDDPTEDEKGCIYCFQAEDVARLFLEMVRTKLPGFTYDFVEYPTLVNGLGYGLFSN